MAVTVLRGPPPCDVIPPESPRKHAQSPLLQKIRIAMNGKSKEGTETYLETTSVEDDGETQTLTWNSKTVIMSREGIIMKQWKFTYESQHVRWACFAKVNEVDRIAATDIPSGMTPDEDRTFKDHQDVSHSSSGPFFESQKTARKTVERPAVIAAVWIFLRTVVHVYLSNGKEYTLQLPILVRHAWPLLPHGVLIQRELTPGEDGDLPSLFSITSVFAEPTGVAIAKSIASNPPYLSDCKDEISPITTLSAHEYVVYVAAPRLQSQPGPIIITFNLDTCVLSIWRYAIIEPIFVSDTQEPTIDKLDLAALKQTRNQTMEHLVTTGLTEQEENPFNLQRHGRRHSLIRTELSHSLDKMVLHGGYSDPLHRHTQSRNDSMRPHVWMHRIHDYTCPGVDPADITAAAFDQRYDGTRHRELLGVCIRSSATLLIFSIRQKEHIFTAKHEWSLSACSIAAVAATRIKIDDLLILRTDNTLSLLTHGIEEIPVIISGGVSVPTSIGAAAGKLVTISFSDGSRARTTFNLLPRCDLVCRTLQMFSILFPHDLSFSVHKAFLLLTSANAYQRQSEYRALSDAICEVFHLNFEENAKLPTQPWRQLQKTMSHALYLADPSLTALLRPPSRQSPQNTTTSTNPHQHLSLLLFALHMLAEFSRVQPGRLRDVLILAPLICHVAMIIRPEWADHWKRLVPEAIADWPTKYSCDAAFRDDRLHYRPPDILHFLYAALTVSSASVPWISLAPYKPLAASYAWGPYDPLAGLNCLTLAFSLLNATDYSKGLTTQARAGNAVLALDRLKSTGNLHRLSIGTSAPLREALRTCQMNPPMSNWPAEAYKAMGREDLWAAALRKPESLVSDGYLRLKDVIANVVPNATIGSIAVKTNLSAGGNINTVTGVELDMEGFTEIRFGQDRRLEEVARMLRSSDIDTFKTSERPELSEQELAREQQIHVVRIAERTLALPYGRAIFTFGSVPNITQDAYSIPKLELQVKSYPHNAIITPELGKVPPENIAWGEFHNGVAAGLRISPQARGIETSWIAFNKPTELTPEHAGFLFALGLTGHLKTMVTWHTFSYLTPKHDLTSIGILLGLSAAYVGTGNKNITKLLAVHNPALLPTQAMDLNVTLATQIAGMSGVGLVYMGSKNRRIAEVCISQFTRRDLVKPDATNENREAYMHATGLAFGMTMLGKGSAIPADVALVERLRLLIHGPPSSASTASPFDVTMTSPGATIALGLMYLRTERQDIADVIAVPDTLLALNRVQPNQLLMRTLTRCLILWNSISPDQAWLTTQVPPIVAQAMSDSIGGKKPDDALEMAYYNILAGSLFAVALKFAGTANHAAYTLIVGYYDMFSRLVYSNASAFDSRIRRASVREALNQISLSLSMVMAGTGELSCFRRFRYAFGMYQHGCRYGVHIATHAAIGVLFMGGGRYTFGTSDAAVANMIAAFYPRFHNSSSDNKTYLQALRHLWVLALEPRCLIARDVDTGDVVYLPVKITMKDGSTTGTTQLISPTLIPDIEKLLAIRVDTPRYWPFYLDFGESTFQKRLLLRSQMLYVKRRTAFLSYTEDPKGSRSLYVRSGSSVGDTATLDYPRSNDVTMHPASELAHFISSFSNNPIFLSFADHLSREGAITAQEKVCGAYCHAALLDSILHDKPQTLQSHITLFYRRIMPLRSPFFSLHLQDLRFLADFQVKLFERQFSGRAENNPRPPLIRETTVLGSLHELDTRLEADYNERSLKHALYHYVNGVPNQADVKDSTSANHLAWYLSRHSVPFSAILWLLNDLARDTRARCRDMPDVAGLDGGLGFSTGLKEIIHQTGIRMMSSMATGWTEQSLHAIIDCWT